MLSDEYIAILRSRTPHLPSLPCVYSTDSDDIASRADYRYGSKTNYEMESIAKFISLTDVTYLEALENFATDSRVLRTPSGGRTTSGGTLYDLLIPLRTLRHWVSSKSVDKWEDLNVEHVFTPHHWYELLRVVSMVYDQERAYADGDGDTVFLVQERFFGPGCQERDCDLWTLYNMFLICQGAVDPEKYERFKQYEDSDSSSSRLAGLSATYRHHFTDYDSDDKYYTDNDSSDRLFHVLPLHSSGLSRPTEGKRNERRRGWRDIRPYNTSPYTRMVYIRDFDTVEVKVNEYFVTLSTTPIPFSFFEEFGVTMKAAVAYYDDGGTGESYYRLNELIEHVNDGNYHAGRFLFSHVFNSRIIASPGANSSWFPYTHENGEEITESLKLQALVDVVGGLLITEDNDIILPVSFEDQLCYLTRAEPSRWMDFYAEWRDADSTTVRAKCFSLCNRGARLLGDFSAKDAFDKHSTLERILKHEILSLESSATVAAAAGVMPPALGVLGVAGVGKTTALQGLEFDDDIQIRFPDGVQYIVLGQEASATTAINEVAKLMRRKGASASAVERSSSLREAVDYAVAKFEGEVCLFLVDDLWPTEDCRTGFLNDLLQLLRSCSHSRMAVATRNMLIARNAGRIVEFDPRASLGAVSVNIFMTHASQRARSNAPQEPTGDLSRRILTILNICAGLPIALAVSGCAVAFLGIELDNFEGACDEYATRLEKERIDLGAMEVPASAGLNAIISLSLKILEAEYLKLRTAHPRAADLTIVDLYTSLCVLRPQAWIPVSVLNRMWKVGEDFTFAVVRLLSKLCLCKQKLGQGGAEEGDLMLHDLHFDYCKRLEKTMKTGALWHTRLLNGYLEPVPSTSGGLFRAEQGGSFEPTLLTYTPRPWWSVADDNYLHANLARHLLSAELVIELAALLLDSRWTHARTEIGGVLALNSDFEVLLSLRGKIPYRVSQSFELIWKAIQLSWGRVAEGQRSFHFQICGRLFNSRTGNAIVHSHLKSVEANTPVPYLLPMNQFYADQHNAQVMEIPIGSTCRAVDYSPRGEYITAGADKFVVVIDASTGEILKRLEGHIDDITCVSFGFGSKQIVSGSADNSVAVWMWETSESPVLVLKGHSMSVSGVAVSSDGTTVFSCSDDCTLRIWNAITGAQLAEFEQQKCVHSIAVANDDQTIAIGFEDGTWKVLDSRTGFTIFQHINAHDNCTFSFAFSSKGQRLATGSRDETIRLWDAATWTRVGEPFYGHTEEVNCVAFSPDGLLIASGSVDGSVSLWNANTGRRFWESSIAHTYISSVAFTPGGERIIFASGDGMIRICETPREAEASQLEREHSAPVRAVAISHDGLQVASASDDGTVSLWHSPSGQSIGQGLEGDTASVKCVSFSNDGRQLVSGSGDHTVRLWDAERCIQVLDPLRGHTGQVSCVSFSSDGLRIFSGSRDRTIRVWDSQSWIQLGDALEGHSGAVVGVSESNDGRHVVSRDDHDEVFIWNLEKRTVVWKSDEWQNDSERSTLSRNESALAYTVTDEEAKNIILSCGQEAPHLWPKSFPAYSVEVYCRGGSVYAWSIGEPTLLGTLPSRDSTWKYNGRRNLFAAGLQSGSVAICELKCDGRYPSDMDGAATSCDGLCHESAISEEVRDTLGTPICYFNRGELASSMFSCPSGGAVELWFSNMVSRLSRACRFDENEAHYLASEHRHRHDECCIIWNDILSETMSYWSSLNCDKHEKKWKAQTHDSRVLFQKVKSRSFIIFMVDFFMAYDDECNLMLIIVPLYKALIVSPEDFSMNDLLDEVPEEQVHFVARRLVQLTSISWKYDCLAYLEQTLRGAERLSKISNLFDGQSLDLDPCSLEALVGCRVGLVDSVLPDVPYSHRVGLEISGTVIGLVLAPTGIAHPEVLRDATLTFDNGITDYIDMSIGGDHDDVETFPQFTGNNARKELNLSYVPQNKDFEKSRGDKV